MDTCCVLALFVVEFDSKIPQGKGVVAGAYEHDTVVCGMPLDLGDLLLVESV